MGRRHPRDYADESHNSRLGDVYLAGDDLWRSVCRNLATRQDRRPSLGKNRENRQTRGGSSTRKEGPLIVRVSAARAVRGPNSPALSRLPPESASASRAAKSGPAPPLPLELRPVCVYDECVLIPLKNWLSGDAQCRVLSFGRWLRSFLAQALAGPTKPRS